MPRDATAAQASHALHNYLSGLSLATPLALVIDMVETMIQRVVDALSTSGEEDTRTHWQQGVTPLRNAFRTSGFTTEMLRQLMLQLLGMTAAAATINKAVASVMKTCVKGKQAGAAAAPQTQQPPASCYICGSLSHKARKCPLAGGFGPGGGHGGGRGGGRGGGGGGRGGGAGGPPPPPFMLGYK
jgi:uncharacterized membrane protein YgcG